MKLRGEVLGNMNLDFSEPTTSTSSFSFKGEAGDRIKFSFVAEYTDYTGKFTVKAYKVE